MNFLTFTDFILFLTATPRRAAVIIVLLSAISGLAVGVGISGIVLLADDLMRPPRSFITTLAVALLVKVMYQWVLVLFFEPRAQKARAVRLTRLGYSKPHQELLTPIELSPKATLTTVAAAMAVAYYLLSAGENTETIRYLTAAVGVVASVGEQLSNRTVIRLICSHQSNDTIE